MRAKTMSMAIILRANAITIRAGDLMQIQPSIPAPFGSWSQSLCAVCKIRREVWLPSDKVLRHDHIKNPVVPCRPVH